MSPRDEFAAAALAGLIQKHDRLGQRAVSTICAMAYEIADEMILRQRPPSDGFEGFAHELLACVVADAWVEWKTHEEPFPAVLGVALDSLERGTRASAMRKVRP